MSKQAQKHPDFYKNNPNNEPTGPLTGHCQKCGSNDLWLWDDNLAYGCNTCNQPLGIN